MSALPAIYVTGLRRSSVNLSDGSRIDLDAGTRIAVDLTAAHRSVSLLAGRAFFRIAHDASKPFVVAVGGRTVTDVGTAFSVSLAQETIEVVLASGGVTIADGQDAPVTLLPGNRFTAHGPGEGRIDQADVNSSLAWRTGYVELRNSTISEAIEQMNRYSRVPVVIADGDAGALRVTGRFRTDDPARFAKTLTEMYPVSIKRGPGGTTRIVLISGDRR